MSQKSEKETYSIHSINGNFTLKGENIFDIAEEFVDWIKKMKEQYNCIHVVHRLDYSEYPPTDRTSVDKK